MHGLELCGLAKGIDESVIRWFGHIEIMENLRTAKRVCVGSRLVGRPWKR